MGLTGDGSEWDAGAGIGSGPGVTAEVQLRRRDGTLHSLELSRALMQSDRVVLTVGREIAERARFSSGFAAREVRFRAAAESTLECVAIILPIRGATGEIVDFRYEYVNDAYCRLVRFKREQLLGRRLGAGVPRVHRQRPVRVVPRGDTNRRAASSTRMSPRSTS